MGFIRLLRMWLVFAGSLRILAAVSSYTNSAMLQNSLFVSAAAGQVSDLQARTWAGLSLMFGILLLNCARHVYVPAATQTTMVLLITAAAFLALEVFVHKTC